LVSWKTRVIGIWEGCGETTDHGLLWSVTQSFNHLIMNSDLVIF